MWHLRQRSEGLLPFFLSFWFEMMESRVYYGQKEGAMNMMNDEMIKKLVEVELANAEIDDDTVVDGKKLKRVLVEVFKLLKSDPNP